MAGAPADTEPEGQGGERPERRRLPGTRQPHRGAERHRGGLAHRREEPGPRRRAGGRAWCTASASYSAAYRDYDVYVHSNQPDRTVTATASNGASHSYRTDSSGYADVYLHAATGDAVKVTVGAASCSTAA